MISIFIHYIAYIISILFILFVPGYCFMLVINAKKKLFTTLENTILSFALSILIVDFLSLILGAAKISINRTNLFFAILGFSIICAIFSFVLSKKSGDENPIEQEKFSKKQIAAVILILGLSFFIRTIYLTGAVTPSATDLGHHMYWANTIVTEGIIPNFQQRDISAINGTYSITPPHNISDFIIGEHIIFAAISLISGISVISYFPIITLFLVDIFSILAIFILVIRLFDRNHEKAINIAILSMLFLGPIFAVAPPQAKFIGGGVVGNIIGNLLLPLALYCFVRALKEKSSIMLSLALIFSMGLFYTHHLTALLFLFTLGLTIFIYLLTNVSRLKNLFFQWRKPIFSFPAMGMAAFAICFALFVYTPTYLTNHAVSTVVGGPTKTGHDGLSLTVFKDTLGEPRLTFAIIGIIILIGTYLIPKLRNFLKDKDFSNFRFEEMLPAVLLLSWLTIISIISLFPTLLFLDIPSGRVANYGTYPFAIIASLAIVEIAAYARNDLRTFWIKKSFLFFSFLLICVYIFTFGLFDNTQNISSTASVQKVQETFHASQYLAKNISPNDEILSDHINLTADSWVKIFFMKDYNYPFYRANLDRYDNGIDRQEKCTLNMIASPSTQDSQNCYSSLGVNYIIVNKKTDSAQFRKDASFELIYSNDDVNIYHTQTK